MEEDINLKDKKKAILICSITIILLMLIVGVSYAYWQRTKVQEDTNVVASACFGVSLEGNEAINLSSMYPTTIEEGMSYTPYTFTITNVCSGESTYIVNLESLAETTFLNTSIRVALDDTNKLYSEYREGTKYYSDSKESRTLISGTLENNASVTYNLRMWIDEKTPTTEQNKIFASKIVVLSGEEGELIDPLIENLETTSTLESINITYNANGDVVPVVCKYGIEEGEYTNTVTSATTTNCNITGLTPNTTYYYQICTETGKGTECKEGSASTNKQVSGECPEGQICLENKISNVPIGSYISITPTSTSYTLSNELSGCTGSTSTCVQNTINPSELTIWRVIKINEDGTVDMVSDKVSSETVYFYGSTGYINFIKGLNTIAAQYTDGVHVERTRHIGYSNQTETLTDTSKLSQTKAPWTKSSGFTDWTSCDTSSYLCGTDETKGAGDRGFEKDYNLVKNVYGNMKGKNPSGSLQEYWLASRLYAYGDSTNWDFTVSAVHISGYLSGYSMRRYRKGFINYGTALTVRPIVTIKANTLIVSGDGQSADTAYTLD